MSKLYFGENSVTGTWLILVSVNDFFFSFKRNDSAGWWSGLVSLTCVSVSMSEVATSKRLGLERYLLSLNWFSSSSSCWLVKAVRGLRHFPNRPDWGPAGGRRAMWSVFGFMWVDKLHLQFTVIFYLISAHTASWIHFLVEFLCLTHNFWICLYW